ncbi:MAG: hypothetical protein ACI9U2_001171 [Bradymonadia bacterium]|jgi:hypothetical protein
MGWLGAIALPLAAVALFMSLNRPDAAPRAVPASEACACDTTALRARLTALQSRIDSLEARPTTAPSTASPVVSRDARDPEDAAPESTATASLRQLTVDQPGLTVHESGNTLRVTNRDPALTGQVLQLEAQTEAGETKMITITVPAPE